MTGPGALEHRPIPANLWDRTCATCGGELEVRAGPTGEQWRHADPKPTAAEPSPSDVQLALGDDVTRRICAICGDIARPGYLVEPVNTAVDAGLFLGKPKQGRIEYRTLPACRNRQACRNRLESRGGTWPVIEGARQRTVPYTGPVARAPAAPASDAPDPLDTFG